MKKNKNICKVYNELRIVLLYWNNYIWIKFNYISNP